MRLIPVEHARLVDAYAKGDDDLLVKSMAALGSWLPNPVYYDAPRRRIILGYAARDRHVFDLGVAGLMRAIRDEHPVAYWLHMLLLPWRL